MEIFFLAIKSKKFPFAENFNAVKCDHFCHVRLMKKIAKIKEEKLSENVKDEINVTRWKGSFMFLFTPAPFHQFSISTSNERKKFTGKSICKSMRASSTFFFGREFKDASDAGVGGRM